LAITAVEDCLLLDEIMNTSEQSNLIPAGQELEGIWI